MACLRLLTFARPRDFSSPCLYSRMTLPTFFWALLPYLRPELLEWLALDDERERLDFLAAADRVPARADFFLPLLLLAELRLRVLLLLLVLREELALPRRLELDFLAVAIYF